nr:hypothetical protein [Aeromicrobium sp.]
MLTDAERERFAQIADVLIPSAEGMPSASQADVDTVWIDVALTHRPDLDELFRSALVVGDGLPGAEIVELLNAEHIPAFEALGTLTAGAYFLNPEIRVRIGYPGQVPTIPRNDVDSYSDLLENVVERGPVYRDV